MFVQLRKINFLEYEYFNEKYTNFNLHNVL
jgi:hypothetical protein